MNGFKRIAIAAALAAAVLSSGCASLNVENDGNGSAHRPNDILSQLEESSRGK